MQNLVPIGGLCNRLRVILSAAETNRNFRVCWAKNKDCGAWWEELFEPLALPNVEMVHCPRTLMPSKWNLRLNRIWKRAIFTEYEIQPYDGVKAMKGIRPTKEIMDRVEQISAAFDEHTIGLHVRRTDHHISSAVSTDEAVMETLTTEIAQNPKVKFYLTSDDENFKRALKDKWPDHILTQECHGTRATLEGMKEAVIDLWTLARTTRILGSYWSSYSDTASEIGDIPITIITHKS